MLREAFLNFGNTAQFTCYIDALDECNEDAIRLAIEYFADLGERAVSQKTKISLCLASRHYPNITMRCYQALNLDEQKDHHEDIQKFVTGKLSGTGRTHSELSEEISARSSGVFLWAALVVQILNKKMDHGATRSQLRADLSAVPAGIEDLLKSILMDGSVFLLPTLLWVLFTTKRLTVSQLYTAAKIGAGCSTVEDLDQTGTTQKQMQLFVLNSSKGLVEFSEGKFPIAQFIHESVREYLLNGGLSVLDDSLAGNLEAKSHSRLAAWCQTTIELGLRDSEVFVDDLWGYALYNLYIHCEEAFKGGALHLSFLDAIPQSTLSHVTDWICGHDRPSLLALLLDFGHECTCLTESLLRRQLQHYGQVNACATVRNDAIEGTIPYLDVNARDDVINSTPLISALYPDSSKVIQLLLDCGADPNLGTSSTSPLRLALKTKQFDVVELLLRYGANPNFVSTHNGVTQSPLGVATRQRSTRLVKSLLEHGADANGNSAKFGEPLADAVSSDLQEILRLLLAHGADANGNSAKFGKPLADAVSSDRQEILRLLLAHGADPNGSIFHRPLHLAIGRRDELMVRLLLKSGADINATDMTHRTALITAVAMNVPCLVRLLLDAGADVNATDVTRRTALVMAAEAGNFEIVRLLVGRGANLDLYGNEAFARYLRRKIVDNAALSAAV